MNIHQALKRIFARFCSASLIRSEVYVDGLLISSLRDYFIYNRFDFEETSSNAIISLLLEPLTEREDSA